MSSFEVRVSGKTALFTDPMSKLGGEKFSYKIPTVGAIKGMLRNIYWKPAFLWVVDELRVMNKIKYVNWGIKVNKYDKNDTSDLFLYTYLKDVEYRIRCHFIFNPLFPEDHNVKKHTAIMHRALKSGGRKAVFLGVSECIADVDEYDFEKDTGAYDTVNEMNFGLMYHSFEYPEQNGETKLNKLLYRPVMRNGIIKFHDFETKKVFVRDMEPQTPFLKVGVL